MVEEGDGAGADDGLVVVNKYVLKRRGRAGGSRHVVETSCWRE